MIVVVGVDAVAACVVAAAFVAAAAYRHGCPRLGCPQAVSVAQPAGRTRKTLTHGAWASPRARSPVGSYSCLENRADKRPAADRTGVVAAGWPAAGSALVEGKGTRRWRHSATIWVCVCRETDGTRMRYRVIAGRGRRWAAGSTAASTERRPAARCTMLATRTGPVWESPGAPKRGVPAVTQPELGRAMREPSGCSPGNGLDGAPGRVFVVLVRTKASWPAMAVQAPVLTRRQHRCPSS